MSTIHIDANKEDIANLVIMPGDPLRAKFIAEEYLDNYINTVYDEVKIDNDIDNYIKVILKLISNINDYLEYIDDSDYFDGTTVNISDDNRKFNQVIDQKNNGVWKFVGWDKESKVMEGDGIQFIGKWIFVPNDTIKPNAPTNDNQKENNNNQNELVTPIIPNNKNVQVTTNNKNKQQKKSSKVKTGDETSLVIYGVCVVISALGILLLKKKSY